MWFTMWPQDHPLLVRLALSSWFNLQTDGPAMVSAGISTGFEGTSELPPRLSFLKHHHH